MATGSSENKVTYGLKNVHYAPITVDKSGGTVSYDTPKKIPGAVELTLEPRGERAEFYADDMLYFTADNNQGYNGTLNIAKMPQQFKQDALGEELESNDSVMIEKQDAKSKDFALMFEFDGDVKATRHLLYSCTASRPNVSSSTRSGSIEPSTTELSFIASGREKDHAVKVSTTPGTTSGVYSAWYDSVYEPTP